MGCAQVLIIDPDTTMRKVLRACLEVDGLRVLEANGVAQARTLLQSESFGLITLDIELESGVIAGREIRNCQDTPIMVVSARTDTALRNAALRDFADDYIFKPFDVHEFVARSHALLRRANGARRSGDEVIKAKPNNGRASYTYFSGLRLDLNGHRIIDPEGSPIELSAMEFKLLNAFATNANRVLSRERLLELSGGAGTSETLDRAIDMRVRRLRNKLNQAALEGSELIRTIRGVGYIFTDDAQLS